ncbi:MAG: tripartite tricarboxylate transporter TctB family protein [Alphaproteobacteria bacterium]|nr:tripartite tricarboxylate transporter TctB family protein [Alphaproteobacteria bacterium]
MTERTHTRRDLVSGIVMLGVAGLYWIEAGKLEISFLDDEVTVRGFPNLLAYALGLFAIALIVQSVIVLVRHRPPAGESLADPETRRRHGMAIGLLAFAVGYVLLAPIIGYVLAATLLIAAAVWWQGARLHWTIIPAALAGAIVLWAVFVRLLGIQLPPGLWF